METKVVEEYGYRYTYVGSPANIGFDRQFIEGKTIVSFDNGVNRDGGKDKPWLIIFFSDDSYVKIEVAESGLYLYFAVTERCEKIG